MNDLFSPVPCTDPKSQQRIDDAVAAHPAYQRDYVWMAIKPRIRESINARWQSVKEFSEANFAAEFQEPGNFYSRLWELNLRHLLLAHLSRMPAEGEPDLISDDFVIECVVPKPVDVPELKLDGLLYDYPSEQIARRVTAALRSKLTQLNGRAANTKRIDYTQTPYIIAICLPESNYMGAKGMSGMDIVEEVLIGAGPLQLTVDSKANTAKMSVSSRSAIQSKNASEIEVGCFQRDEYKPVSAVLWCSEYLPEASDLKVLLNPNANIPLDPSNLPEVTEVITYTRNDTGYTRDQPLTNQ